MLKDFVCLGDFVCNEPKPSYKTTTVLLTSTETILSKEFSSFWRRYEMCEEQNLSDPSEFESTFPPSYQFLSEVHVCRGFKAGIIVND